MGAYGIDAVVLRVALTLALVACAGSAQEVEVPIPSVVPVLVEPALVPVPSGTFPALDVVRATPPAVANLSPTACVVAWTLQAPYRSTFLFRTDDGGATFRSAGEVAGMASEAAYVDGRLYLLLHYEGDGLLPEILVSEDEGATWKGQGAIDVALGEGPSNGNVCDQMAFREGSTGRVRVNGEFWLQTRDGGAFWTGARSEPKWSPAPPIDGPCGTDGHTLTRRTVGGTWEPVPGAPLAP